MYSRIFRIFLVIFIPMTAWSQTPNRYYPWSFDFYQKLDRTVYGPGNAFHSSLKPYAIDHPVIAPVVDSLFNYALDARQRSWVHRKLFHEHLIDIRKDEFTFYADYLPDLQGGKESEKNKTTWLNTRGFQAGGTIGSKFSFYTSIYENQAQLPGYLDRIVVQDSIIPGQSFESHLLAGRTRNAVDWSYSTAVLSYTPVKYINLQLGSDKNFIGDGYRSMILSDLASSYPYFKTTFELGRFRYMAMWAQFQDLKAEQFSYESGFRKKWGAFHYLDWNINKRVSLGFFEATIWQDADSTGKRGFDFSYLNPILLLRPAERQNGSPDNAMVGLNAKFEVLNRTTLYGQFLLDELTVGEFFSSSGYWANKWGLQLGFRGYDPFGLKNFHYLFEYNTARPFTYSEAEPINNYAHYNQPLAHPLGSNFREFLTIWNWSWQRLGLRLQQNIAMYGVDPAGQNLGSDLYRSYDSFTKFYGNRIGQGIRTNFKYTDLRASWMLKPNLNFRLEAGLVFRDQSSSLEHYKTTWFTFGIRSSLRNLYQDF